MRLFLTVVSPSIYYLNDLINKHSWISSLKLYELLARTEKPSGQTTDLPKSKWYDHVQLKSENCFWQFFYLSGEILVFSEACIQQCRLVLPMYSVVEPWKYPSEKKVVCLGWNSLGGLIRICRIRLWCKIIKFPV